MCRSRVRPPSLAPYITINSMGENEKDGKRPVIKVYSWELSATHDWNPETELLNLRDLSPEELVKWLNSDGTDYYVQCSAIFELICHGCHRKAAELARALVEADPEVQESITSKFSEPVCISMLTTPLEYIPSDPIEFNPKVSIEYIEKEETH